MQSSVTFGNWAIKAEGLKDIYLLQLSANFVKIELSPWIAKYSPERRFSMKIITLALSTASALFVLTVVAKEGREEGGKK